MKKKATRGGARKGSGRKPSIDPKEPLTIYVLGSILAKVKEPKTVCINALEKAAKKV